MKRYGYNLGMAFQIVDDILDVQATSEEVGKPVGNDLAQGVMTLPAIMAIERHPKDNPIVALFEDPGNEARLMEAVEMIRSSSIIDEAYEVADRYCRGALDCVGGLPDGPSRAALEALTHYVLKRRQ